MQVSKDVVPVNNRQHRYMKLRFALYCGVPQQTTTGYTLFADFHTIADLHLGVVDCFLLCWYLVPRLMK